MTKPLPTTKELQAQMAELTARLQALSFPAIKRTHTEVVAETQDLIRACKTPAASRWAPSKPTTQQKNHVCARINLMGKSYQAALKTKYQINDCISEVAEDEWDDFMADVVLLRLPTNPVRN